MNIEFYCPLWGSDQISFDDFVMKVSAAGYDGVEMPFPMEEPEEQIRRVELLKASGLKLIAQHYETETGDPAAHAEEYEKRIRALTAADPVFISSQTGRDFFEYEDSLVLLALAARVSEETGIRISHETHRSKLTYAAHVTRRYLEKLPQMRLTLDVSHWFCVHERFLYDQEDALALAIERTDHIHARVGHDQGSQVPDFRMPEWKESLERHLSIWDRIIERARNEGRETFTVTPEFGPAPYTLFQPGTNTPLAVQWDLNTDMMMLLKDRWS